MITPARTLPAAPKRRNRSIRREQQHTAEHFFRMSIRQYSGKAGAKIEVKPVRHKMFSDIAFPVRSIGAFYNMIFVFVKKTFQIRRNLQARMADEPSIFLSCY